MKRIAHNKGVSVIEVLIGLVIFSLSFVFISHAIHLYFLSQSNAVLKFQALYLAQEGQEMLRFLRDEDWATLDGLTKETSYGFDVASTTLAHDNNPETVGIFTRTFELHDAYRNNDDDLVASTTSGASVDGSSMIAIVSITWGDGEQLHLESLLTDLHNQ